MSGEIHATIHTSMARIAAPRHPVRGRLRRRLSGWVDGSG